MDTINLERRTFQILMPFFESSDDGEMEYGGTQQDGETMCTERKIMDDFFLLLAR